LTLNLIQENIRGVRGRIAEACRRAGRDISGVGLIAVSKTFGTVEIAEAGKEGIVDFGENYIQELREKREVLTSPEIRWHFIGHLQRNKIRYIAEWVHMVHAVDSLRLAGALSAAGTGCGRRIPVLIEVNTTGETSKYGISPGEAPELIRTAAELPSISVEGLMTMGPLSEHPGDSRSSFRTLREIALRMRAEGYPLPHLSMGMTGDFEIAIEEGATLIRIGTAIFGTRTAPHH